MLFLLSDICQIRLDFTATSLQQPVATTGATAGDCSDTKLEITPGTSSGSIHNKPPTMCGTLTGQHGKSKSHIKSSVFLGLMKGILNVKE